MIRIFILGNSVKIIDGSVCSSCGSNRQCSGVALDVRFSLSPLAYTAYTFYRKNSNN